MNLTIQNEIKKLSLSERILLVEEIWDSIMYAEEYPELTENQQIELNERINSYHANPTQGTAWNEIKRDFWESRQS